MPIRIKKKVSSLKLDQNDGPHYVTGCCDGLVKSSNFLPGFFFYSFNSLSFQVLSRDGLAQPHDSARIDDELFPLIW